MIVLNIIEGNSRGQVYKFDSTSVSVGRSPDNDLPLDDYHLSGRHGRVFSNGGQFLFSDLRSTNGSTLKRDQQRIPVDARVGWEISLRTGDELILGDPAEPVVIQVTLPELKTESDREVADRLVASRSIVDLPVFADRVEHDPASALRIYKALQPLSAGVDMQATLEATVAATFELLPRATHVAILLRSDVDHDRFTLALADERSATGQTRVPTASENQPDPVLASQAVLRRVLKDRAAVLTNNAPEDISSSDSILSGRILSMVAIPMWRRHEITGLIQADNRRSAGMFDESDLEVALLLGAQAALALDNASLVSRLKIADERLRGENNYLKRKQEEHSFEKIVGESKKMKEVLAQLRKVLNTRATVCIEGETGTGKELIASAIHYESQRREQMFVAQNCAAMPENLLESELFGHKKGAFTGADSDKSGLFEIADGGTLFLDEIGEMPLSLQAKLLRVLQEGTVRAVGATREKQVDVRIVCATNRDMAREVEARTFRQDLYYRLMVFPIRLPPLRERRDDIPALAQHFLRRYCDEFRCNVRGFAQGVLDALCAYAWPGNIRELENEIQRLVIQVENDGWIEIENLSPRIRNVEGALAKIAPKKGTLKEMVEEVERWLLAESLRQHDGNKTATAKTLGITREGLHKKLSKFGMNPQKTNASNFRE